MFPSFEHGHVKLVVKPLE